MDYQVTHSKKDGPDPDYRIDALAGSGWRNTIDQTLASIDAGHTFWVSVSGRRVEVIPMRHTKSGRRYVTTQADGFPPNNLLSLPNCS